MAPMRSGAAVDGAPALPVEASADLLAVPGEQEGGPSHQERHKQACDQQRPPARRLDRPGAVRHVQRGLCAAAWLTHTLWRAPWRQARRAPSGCGAARPARRARVRLRAIRPCCCFGDSGEPALCVMVGGSRCEPLAMVLAVCLQLGRAVVEAFSARA